MELQKIVAIIKNTNSSEQDKKTIILIPDVLWPYFS